MPAYCSHQVRVPALLDAIRAEPAERTLDGLAHMFGPAIGTDDVVLIEAEAELRRDHDALPCTLQLPERPGQQRLVLEWPAIHRPE